MTLMRRALTHFLPFLLGFCVCLPVSAQEITLGAGDIVKISVYGQEDLDTVVRVTNEGNISFPLVGEVQIAGLTAREAEATLARLLSEGNFVRDPQVSVFIEQRRTAEREAVTILGQVARPGRFAVETLSEGGAESIVGILALAGGVQDDAADHLILAREVEGKSSTRKVDLVALLSSGDVSQNFPLSEGDIVFVPRMEVFYIYGEVEEPGRYRLERNMTVMQAISVSGGMTEFGSEKDIFINRRGGQGQIADYRAKLTDLLRPDDVVHVTN